jgi:hypothetical protein
MGCFQMRDTYLMRFAEASEAHANAFRLAPGELLSFFEPHDLRFRAGLDLPASNQPQRRLPIVAFTGTGRSFATWLPDVLTSVLQVVGFFSGDDCRAMELGSKLKAPIENFSFTGHSLGGRLASAVASPAVLQMITFNAAGWRMPLLEAYCGSDLSE